MRSGKRRQPRTRVIAPRRTHGDDAVELAALVAEAGLAGAQLAEVLDGARELVVVEGERDALGRGAAEADVEVATDHCAAQTARGASQRREPSGEYTRGSLWGGARAQRAAHGAAAQGWLPTRSQRRANRITGQKGAVTPAASAGGDPWAVPLPGDPVRERGTAHDACAQQPGRPEGAPALAHC